MHVIQALRSLVFISVTFRSVAAFAIASEPPSDDDPIATPVVDPKRGTAYATFVPVPEDNSKRSLSQVRRSESSFFHDTSAFLSPYGYSVTHSSLSCAINGAGYLTYVTLKTYSPSDCASICDNAKSCQFFNIYYERNIDDNSLQYDAVQCALYSEANVASKATNCGQWRGSFQVQLTGSNGYSKASSPKGVCSADRPAPSAIGGAALASIPAVGQMEIGVSYVTFGTYGGCSAGDPVYSSVDTTPTDHFAYYAFPDSSSEGVGSLGYVYHVESGLCMTQQQVSSSKPAWGTSVTPSNTTLQPCEANAVAPPPSQGWGPDSYIPYTSQGYSYDCFVFKGDGGSNGAWYAFDFYSGNQIHDVGTGGPQTYRGTVSTSGGWCFWIKTKP